ncbi:prolipoprotein diacylglyceryl transferase [Halobacteriovorax sp. GFR7]|uniref:prolipoprotein diacylglyceryl transferase n=1 Tax=unclassified Halobacteriovorax TaxID=2639665 RepID=UPI003D954CE1
MITWNVDPEIFRIGPIAVRYYSLMFIVGFFIGERYCRRYLIKEKDFTTDEVSSLLNYMIVGCVVGARLGHCLFYEPGYYLSNPLEILYVWKGGLASHGGFLGVIVSIYAFKKRVKDVPLMWLLDLVAAPALMTGGFIRLGNLMNSEIFGHPTNLPWAFKFVRADNIPRHPTQLYEALGFFAISGLVYYLYSKFHNKWQSGRFLGIIFIGGFSWRFFVEFFKENQVAFEQGMALNMGQILSIPLVIVGIILVLYKPVKKA